MAKTSTTDKDKDAQLIMAGASEEYIALLSPELLNLLLRDHSAKHLAEQRNGGHEEAPDDYRIIWATHDYQHLGEAYYFERQMKPELITGDNAHVVMPRVVKSRTQQATRVRRMAEVFTPSWICNAQNNLVDEAWFGRKAVFNTEHPDHSWTATRGCIAFPEGKTWHNYVREKRLEMTCGEAPYLASRYDAATGRHIPVAQRIGLLDRKLRVVSENTDTPSEWLAWGYNALKSLYGYEWQGDSLLIARANLLLDFGDHYAAQFGEAPPPQALKAAAYFIGWNLWQMDGLRYTSPLWQVDEATLEKYRREERRRKEAENSGQFNLFTGMVGESAEAGYEQEIPFCVIRDWNKSEKEGIEEFVKSIKQ